MRKKIVPLAVFLLLTLALELGLGRRWGQLPPLGRFFSPVLGFWKNAESPHTLPPREISIPSLEDSVLILWDQRWIPHIFAKNEADLYRAQGYIQAYLRLWQMEIQSDAASGQLSRILGEDLLPHDRAMRRLGLPYAAERAMEAVQQDSLSWAVLIAFSEGVNAFLAHLSPDKYPIEYKLLDYKPRPWSPIRSLYLVKYMAYDLTTKSQDKYLSHLLPRIGKGAIDTLFPDDPPLGFSTILSGKHLPTREIPPQPTIPYSEEYIRDSAGHAAEEDPFWLGSNNWAVSGIKTASGYPLLANDPHLTLSLPSIWLEMHLIAPTVNTYGVTLLGAPGVIIGYNPAIAWGVTNVGADAMDFYRLRYTDTSQRSFYYEGQLIDLHPRPESIWVRTPLGRQKLFIDTVWYSPWGPVVHRSRDVIRRPLSGKAREAPIDCALRWVSYEPSNEARCFYELNRARSIEDYLKALRHFGSPAQNFIYADTMGHIALWVRGFYPLRWKDQGKFVLDAEKAENHWRDWLSFEENPHSIDPPEGFVRSANSYPAGKEYPYYLGWYFALPDRAARIEERLRSLKKADVDSFRLLQVDVVSFTARRALPILLSYVASTSPWIDTLRRWDYRFSGESRAATLFRWWWDAFHRLLWDSVSIRRPEWEITLKLIEETHQAHLKGLPSPHPRWITVRDSGARSLSSLVQQAWEKVESRIQKEGTVPPWWRYRGTQIRHIARLPGLGTDTLRIAGEAQCVNALGSSAGPSWRMVVDLTPPVQGYGVYPGGQSGNPGSFHYDDFIPTWQKGELYQHHFVQRKEDLPPESVIQQSTLHP